jgi:diguanylate cyclase
MGWILAVMLAFGVAVGFIFPLLVGSLVAIRPEHESAFSLACVLAGFCVGAFAYGVARFTLFRANQRLAGLAAYDGLTGLLNQRQFPRRLETELERGRRADRPTSLVVLDLDHFKRVNDEYGHAVGDLVLAGLAADVRAALRSFDVPCRIGGDEFAVILPDTDKRDGLEVVQRIRERAARGGDGSLPPVTMSCGVATHPDDAASAKDLCLRADAAMYRAKAAGRDAVMTWCD